MIAPVRHYKGNRQPPLFDTISADDSTLFDAIPSGSTITFYMRNALSSTLKVNGAAAVLVSEPLNQVRYDWAATDVDTAGYYAGWWRVTLPSAQYEETPEFLIVIDDHVAQGNEYVSVEELKNSRQIGRNFMDADVQQAVAAASRAIDGYCGQVFYLGSSATRKYTAYDPDFCYIDPVSVISSVTASGVTLVADTDYAVEGSAPWRVLRSLTTSFPAGTVNAITVTGQFGYASIPPEVKSAAVMLAGRIAQMQREGGMLGLSFDGSAVPIGLFDRNLQSLLAPYKLSSIAL